MQEGWQDIQLDVSCDTIRIYALQEATQYGISIYELQILNQDGSNIAATYDSLAASYEEGSHVAANAVDGDEGSRWGSNGGGSSPHNWLEVCNPPTSWLVELVEGK